MRVLVLIGILTTSCASMMSTLPGGINIGDLIGSLPDNCIPKNPIEQPGKKPQPKPQPSPQPAPQKPKDPIKDQDPTIEIAIVNAINHARAAKGLNPVSIDNNLGCAAQIHAEDIGPKKICGHTGSDGSNPTERLARCDYRGGWGEIVACGQKSPEEAVKGWHNSPGHAAIMYDSKNTHIGAYMINNFWVAVFR